MHQTHTEKITEIKIHTAVRMLPLPSAIILALCSGYAAAALKM